MNEIITRHALFALVNAWITDGVQIAGPTRIDEDRIVYARMDDSDRLVLDGFVRPVNSIKEFVFPRHEKLYGYRFIGKNIELTDPELPAAQQVILGARPCDAAALPILDHVFNWDYVDGFYKHHRERTVVISIACERYDEHCFCTSVGLGPAHEKGSDVMLLELGDDVYEVRCLTERGKALFDGKTRSSDQQADAPTGPPRRMDLEAVNALLSGDFDDPRYQTLTMRCVGCGACAFTCPTCHCFDIVCEGNAAGGHYVKNWDTCQLSMFTHHASGHNPRTCQGHRQRQRIHHKFRMYPEKFGEVLCTGCGNCTRNCPVDLGVLSVLEAFSVSEKTESVEVS